MFDIHHITENIEREFVIMYGDGDMISSSEGILFECSSGLKVITISEDMSLDALRKTIMDLFTSTCLLRVYGA